MEFSPTRDSTGKLRFSVVSELSGSNVFSLATAQNLLGSVSGVPARQLSGVWHGGWAGVAKGTQRRLRGSWFGKPCRGCRAAPARLLQTYLFWAGSGDPTVTALPAGLGFTASRVWARSEPKENRCSLLPARVKLTPAVGCRNTGGTGEPGQDAAGTASVQGVDGAPATVARPVASERKPLSPKSLLLCCRVPCSFFFLKNVGMFLRSSAWLP